MCVSKTIASIPSPAKAALSQDIKTGSFVRVNSTISARFRSRSGDKHIFLLIIHIYEVLKGLKWPAKA